MILFYCSFAICAQYAILYCGSSTIWNYRHQADIYTIYNQLIDRGFTSSNIVLYAYDDIATDYTNPFKGQVFHSTDHKINVYPGSNACNFRRSSITADAYYECISKLPTTKEDYVFLYYNNHGGPGFLGTPENGPSIIADQLSNSFTTAYQSNCYKKCLFFIEACYSGSVAKFLTAPDLAIITAANESEPSNPESFDKIVGQFLTNEFTNHFIDLIDENPLINVGDLFTSLKNLTKLSHVMYYGDETIKSIPISTFIGKPEKASFSRNKNNFNEIEKVDPSQATEKTLNFHTMYSTTKVKMAARLQMLKNKALKERIEVILEMIVKHLDPLNFDEIMNDNNSDFTKTYFEVLPLFLKKAGTINPDDYGRLTVIKALSARHSADYIIQGINNVLN